MACSHCTGPGTGQGTGNGGFLYYAMYCTHYTGTETGNHCYRPQRSCGQGYVFTRVCDSVHGGGVLRRTPPGTKQTPPPRQEEPPPDQADPPGPGRHPPQQGEPPLRTRQTPPGRGLQHTVNERPVRILLECILVFYCVHPGPCPVPGSVQCV